MKIAPLAVWMQYLNENMIMTAVPAEVEIVHSSTLMKQMATAYCLAIRYLIRNYEEEGRATKAFEAVSEYARNCEKKTLEFLLDAKRLIGKEDKEGFINIK